MNRVEQKGHVSDSLHPSWTHRQLNILLVVDNTGLMFIVCHIGHHHVKCLLHQYH